tara:strand:- start:543 stop:755 length:213 start_codon:yes stop_codon:yes gene_type:complete
MKYINQKLVLAILPLFVGIAACGVTPHAGARLHRPPHAGARLHRVPPAGARLHRVQYTVLNRFSKFQIQP